MQNYKEDQGDPLLKPHRTKASLGQRLRYSFQNTNTIQQIYNGGQSLDTKTSPKRENNRRTTINLPKTPTLFYSLRRQPKRNIQTLTQSSQIERRNTMQISTGISVNLDYDYGQVSQIEVLEVSQRPTAQNGDTRKKSGASRMQSRIKFKTIEQSQEHRRTQSQLARSGDLTFEKTAPCLNCLKNAQKTVSMANEIEELHDQISGMLADISRLAADLQQAKFLVIGSKITKENQSIKRSHVTENLELKVKLLQDSLTLRNQQFQEQEKQNQTLVQMLEKYDAKLELAQEQLELKEKSASKTIPDINDRKILEDMMAYHLERLQNLKELKQKAQKLAKIQSEDLQKVSFGHIPSNFRQSQKSINESNYSSEPMLANVKFN